MDKQTLDRKLKFIEEYKQASNAATGSQFDSNANVPRKNIAKLNVGRFSICMVIFIRQQI